MPVFDQTSRSLATAGSVTERLTKAPLGSEQIQARRERNHLNSVKGFNFEPVGGSRIVKNYGKFKGVRPKGEERDCATSFLEHTCAGI
jgi:hypothetical protein